MYCFGQHQQPMPLSRSRVVVVSLNLVAGIVPKVSQWETLDTPATLTTSGYTCPRRAQGQGSTELYIQSVPVRVYHPR